MTRSSWRGGTPQDTVVPLPRGTTASSCSVAAASRALASLVSAGEATQGGVRPPTASRGPPGRTARQARASDPGTDPALKTAPRC